MQSMYTVNDAGLVTLEARWKKKLHEAREELALIKQSPRLHNLETFSMWSRNEHMTPLEYLNTPEWVLADFDVYDRYEYVNRLEELLDDITKEKKRREGSKK